MYANGGILAALAFLKNEWDEHMARRVATDEERERELDRTFRARESMRRERMRRRGGAGRAKRRQRHVAHR